VKAAASNRVAGNIKAFASERGGLAARNNDFATKLAHSGPGQLPRGLPLTGRKQKLSITTYTSAWCQFQTKCVAAKSNFGQALSGEDTVVFDVDRLRGLGGSVRIPPPGWAPRSSSCLTPIKK